MDGLEHFAWPGATVIITIAGMLVFRRSIAGLIVRTTAVTRDGLQAESQTSAVERKEAVPDANGSISDPSGPLLDEEITRILSDLKPNTDPAERERRLIRHLAACNIAIGFERAHHIIFGSQLQALELLNQAARDWQAAEQHLRPIFVQAAAQFPNIHQNRSFDQWLQFMLLFRFIERNPDGTEVRITIYGREFLVYLIQRGYPLRRFA